MFFRSFVLIRWKQLSSVPKTEISFFVSKNLNKNSKTRRRRRKKRPQTFLQLSSSWRRILEEIEKELNRFRNT
jgi:hypothetical protein